MSTLPATGYLSNAARTNAEMKTALEDVRNTIAELLGGSAGEASPLTIAGDSATPTAAVHRIDTEAAAAADDLKWLAQTNHPEGRLVLIRATDAGRVVTVKHAAGGVGQILLSNSADFVLNSTGKYILLKRYGTQWDEVYRSYGADSASARAFLGLTAAATAPAPVAADYGKHLMAVPAGGAFALAGPLVSYRNVLVNGGFDVWQLGTSFAAADYTADQWKLTLGTGAAVTVSQQSHTLGQTNVPGEPKHFLRFDRTTAGSVLSSIENRRESVRTLAGQAVSVGFYAKASSAVTLDAKLTQYFGTGGSPSANVDHSLGGFALTTSWQYLTAQISLASLSGKTIGSNANDYLSLVFELPTAAGVVSIDISDAQVERGGITTPFERLPYEIELHRAQRYCAKSFEQGTTPGTNTSVNQVEGGAAGAGAGRVCVNYPVLMRAAPTLTVWAGAGSGTIGKVRREATDENPNIVSIGADRFTNEHTAGRVAFHWLARAEL